jgi:hypothetical protein
VRAAAATIIALLLAATPTSARIWYITPDGTGDAPTIQAAIDSAAAGDEVFLASGTFHEIEIRMKSRIVLRGTAADWTILQGADQHTTLHCDAIQNVRIEDLQFIGGDYRMSVLDSQVDISRCTFRGGDADSMAGRALHSESSTLFLSDCLFAENSTWGDPSGRGAGIYCRAGDLSLEGCLFENNVVSGDAVGFGAGVFATGSTVVLDACEFRGNRAGNPEGGGVPPLGVGAGLYADSSTVTIARCTFAENLAARMLTNGEGGGAAIRNCGAVTIDDCQFVDNRGGFGASVAIRIAEGVVIRRCTFRGNRGREGSAIWCHRTFALTEDCLFVSNDNQAVWARGYNPGDSDLQLDRCTWFGTTGVSIYSYVWGSITVRNSIVANGTLDPGVECFYGEMMITCTNIWGNHGGDWVGCVADQAHIDGNFSADPLFCDADLGDFTLSSASPCLPGNHPDGVDCGLIGAFGQGCGPVSVEPETWAGIKARYRGGGP